MGIRTGAEALAATWSTPEPDPNGPDGPQCLNWVWQCYGSVQSNLPPLSSVAYAKQGWIYSKQQHPGDRNPPAGAPVYFSGSDGHIAIATGNGEEVRSTEWPWGSVGTSSISQIEQAWGRTYYGWTGDMLGHTIDFGQAASPVVSKRKRNRMFLIWDTVGTGSLVTEDGVLPLASPQVYNLFYRVINSDQFSTPFEMSGFISGSKAGRPQIFLKAETDIINANLRLLAASVQTGVAVDVEKLARALATALGKSFDVNATIDEAELATAFNAAVPAIVSSMLKQTGQKLAA